MEPIAIKSAIHTISSVLEIPAIILLIIAVVVTVAEAGSVIAEFFYARAGKKVPAAKLLAQIYGKNAGDQLEIIQKERLLRGQRAALEFLLKDGEMPRDERRLLAVQLLSDEEHRLERIMQVTDVIARVAPMFGLMATLIPLGPGLLALGQGDTKTLADSLLTAFDATVAGLAAAGVSFIISKVRKRWYQGDMSALETIMEGVIG